MVPALDSNNDVPRLSAPAAASVPRSSLRRVPLTRMRPSASTAGVAALTGPEPGTVVDASFVEDGAPGACVDGDPVP